MSTIYHIYGIHQGLQLSFKSLQNKTRATSAINLRQQKEAWSNLNKNILCAQ